MNVTKTKTVIFSKGKVCKYPLFYLGNEEIEVKHDHVSLGVTLNYHGFFKKAMYKQITQARKAPFVLTEKARRLWLPADIVLEIFLRPV